MHERSQLPKHPQTSPNLARPTHNSSSCVPVADVMTTSFLDHSEGVYMVKDGRKGDKGTPHQTPLEQLAENELPLLRKLGQHDPKDELHKCRVFMRIAARISSEADDRARVRDVLEQAAARLGTVYGPTILALFGLTAATAGKEVAERHELAYEVFSAAQRARLASGQKVKLIVFSTFETHEEKVILKDLSIELIALYKEHQRPV